MPVLDPAAVVLTTLAVSVVLFATDAVRYDLVALIVVLTLALTGTLTPEEAFRGLASDPVILIASMYVFGQAFTKTGVAEALGARVLRPKDGSERGLVTRITLVSGLPWASTGEGDNGSEGLGGKGLEASKREA